jgi:DNA polymerase III subunit chi
VTRVDFYILADVDLEARRRFACRLACLAVTRGQRVHVHLDDAAASADFDALLWAYPDNRFLPHGVSGDTSVGDVPVAIDHAAPEHGSTDLLINLGGAIPQFFGRFDRVAEIIVQQLREDGRRRYKFYRDRGYPLFHHEIDQWDDR